MTVKSVAVFMNPAVKLHEETIPAGKPIQGEGPGQTIALAIIWKEPKPFVAIVDDIFQCCAILRLRHRHGTQALEQAGQIELSGAPYEPAIWPSPPEQLIDIFLSQTCSTPFGHGRAHVRTKGHHRTSRKKHPAFASISQWHASPARRAGIWPPYDEGGARSDRAFEEDVATDTKAWARRAPAGSLSGIAPAHYHHCSQRESFNVK